MVHNRMPDFSTVATGPSSATPATWTCSGTRPAGWRRNCSYVTLWTSASAQCGSGRPFPAAGKDQPNLSELFARLRQVAARTRDPQTALELHKLLDLQPAAHGEDTQLTARQVDVLALAALGLTNERIASSLALSPLTVKSYLRSAMARLGARTRYEAVIEARRLGILP